MLQAALLEVQQCLNATAVTRVAGSVSAVQRDALLTELPRMGAPQGRELSSALMLASTLRWACDEDRDAVVECIAKMMSPAPLHAVHAVSCAADATAAVPGRRSMQQWGSLLNYWNKRLRGVCGDDNFTFEMKLNAILAFLIQLGLRNPSEPTCKVMTAAVMCAMQGPESACTMEVAVAQTLYKKVKTTHKRMCAKVGPPVVHIVELPQAPIEFRDLYPNVYAGSYTNDPPIGTGWDTTQVLMAEPRINCRGGRMAGDTSRAISNTDATSGLQAMMGMFSQLMPHIAQAQASRTPAWLNTFEQPRSDASANAGGVKLPPRAMQALQHSATQALEGATLGGCRQLVNAVGEGEGQMGLSEPERCRPHPNEDTSPKLAMSSESSPPSAAKRSRDVVDSIQDVLEGLAERDKETADERRLEKRRPMMQRKKRRWAW